jgi:uncharacterized protein YegP (UPF0339 family)
MREPLVIALLVIGGLVMLWLARREHPIEVIGYEERRRMRAEVFRGESGEWFFRIQAANNEIIAQSEGYKNRQDAIDTALNISLEKFPIQIEDEEDK